MEVLPPKYTGAEYAVLILGIALLYNMTTGINNVILMVSKYYRYDTAASVMLALFSMLTNLWLIPRYGLIGAAFATLISVVTYHSFKSAVVYVKMKMHPWTWKTVYGIIVLLVIGVVMHFIPDYFEHFLMNIVVRCLIITVLSFPTIYYL